MASVDKASVREEVGRLKTDFQTLCAKGKVSAEIQVLMNSLFMIVELMLSIFLERKTRKTNHNSSIPSSQTDKDDTAIGYGGSNGKGKGGQSGRAGNTRTSQSTTIAALDDRLDLIENTAGPCAFIGKPAEVATLRTA